MQDVSTLTQIKLIGWLRWRLFMAMLRAPGAKAELVARFAVAAVGAVVTVVLSLGLAAGAFAIMHARPQKLNLLLWGVFLAGQFLPLILSVTAANFDTRTLLRFPMRFSSFAALALSYCLFDPLSLSTLLWLGSVAAGAALARADLAVWILASVALLAVVSVLLNRLALLWTERLMARRRSREMVFLVFIGSMLSLQLLVGSLNRYGDRIRPVVSALLPALDVFPPAIAAGAIAAGNTAPRPALQLLGALAVWCTMIGWWLRKRLLAQYRGEELSEAVTVQAAGPPREAAASAPGWLAPFLPNQRAALLGKEFRYLFRNAVTVLQLGIPFFLIIFFGLMMDPKGKELGFFHRRPDAILPSAIGYAIFIALPIAHNSLSFESWGIQLLYLAPVRFREALVAKNLALGLAIYGQALAVLALVSVLFAPQTPVIVAASFTALLFMMLLNFSLGNLLSVYFPRAFNFGSFQQRQSAWSVIAAMLAQLVGMAVVYLMYVIALWRGNAWYAVAGYGLLSAAMAQVYFMGLERAEEVAIERREQIVAELCRYR